MNTVSIRETCANLPGGHVGPMLSWAQVSDHIREHYLKNRLEEERIKKFQERQRLFLGCSESDMEAMIDRVFKDPEVRQKRREWVSFAKYNNVLRRVIMEQASVYSLPAERTVGIAPERTQRVGMSIGERIHVAPGKEHEPEHRGKGATVSVVQGQAIGVTFDGETAVHKWYAPDELVADGGMASPEDDAAYDAAYDAAVEQFNEQNRRYQEVLRLCRFHEVMQRLNAMLLLHRAVVVRPRMRKQPDGQWVPTIDLVTPANFYAVRDPVDATLCIALVFFTTFQLAKGAQGPKWELLTWHERCWINSSGAIMETDGSSPPRSMIEEHGMGRIPAILATLDPPDGALLDESTGEDLVAAQKSVTFLTVLMLKEAKSATKTTVVAGDVSPMLRKQADDSEVPIQTPEGVQVSTHDRAMDFLSFDDGAERVTRSVAANHGVSPEEMKNATPTSAHGLDLRRVPLRERRLQQHVPLRQIEFDVAVLLSQVVAQYRPDLAFTTEGWNIDFADPQTPLGTAEALQVLEKELQLGLTSELRAIMDRNPDLTYEQAKQILLQLIEDRTFRIEAMKRFMIASGGMAQGAIPADVPGDGSIPRPVQSIEDDEQDEDDKSAREQEAA